MVKSSEQQAPTIRQLTEQAINTLGPNATKEQIMDYIKSAGKVLPSTPKIPKELEDALEGK